MSVWFWVAAALFACRVANVAAMNTSANGILDLQEPAGRSEWKSNALMAVFWPAVWMLLLPDVLADMRESRRSTRERAHLMRSSSTGPK